MLAPSAPIHIVIAGAHGRMGQTILRLATDDPEVKVVGGIDKLADHPHSHGHGTAAQPVLNVTAGLSALSPPKGTVLIDFSNPEGLVDRAREAGELGIPLVIGTTGLSASEIEELRAVSHKVPVILAANTSLGVTVLLDAVKRLAQSLPGYDIEVVEMHHRMKVDAPSGTALALAKAAADGLGEDLDEVARHGRHGNTGKRTAREIGMHALRGGDVVGDHTVTFAGIGERIEVTHRASSRDTFASGAIRAAKWIARQQPGWHGMADVLGLSANP